MHRATSLDREIVLTHASLLVASAREGGFQLQPNAAAREILAAHPEVHVTELGLTELIAEMLSCAQARAASLVVAESDLGPHHLSCERAG